MSSDLFNISVKEEYTGNGSTDESYTQIADGSGYFYTTLFKNRFTREGYRSTSPSYDSEQDVWYNDGEMPVLEGTEITLYAQWEEITE